MSHSRRIKTLTQQVAALRGLTRLGRKTPDTVPDKAMVAYFAATNTVEDTRRTRTQPPR